MSLYHEPAQPSSDAEFLATEARKQLTQLADTTFHIYANCRNYEVNNGKGVSAEDFKKAFGADRKGFESTMRAMKRLILQINPNSRDKFDSLIPTTAKAPK